MSDMTKQVKKKTKDSFACKEKPQWDASSFLSVECKAITWNHCQKQFDLLAWLIMFFSYVVCHLKKIFLVLCYIFTVSYHQSCFCADFQIMQKQPKHKTSKSRGNPQNVIMYGWDGNKGNRLSKYIVMYYVHPLKHLVVDKQSNGSEIPQI